jgi:hypothetical protein
LIAPTSEPEIAYPVDMQGSVYKAYAKRNKHYFDAEKLEEYFFINDGKTWAGQQLTEDVKVETTQEESVALQEAPTLPTETIHEETTETNADVPETANIAVI